VFLRTGVLGVHFQDLVEVGAGFFFFAVGAMRNAQKVASPFRFRVELGVKLQDGGGLLDLV
jgi:hypothetical protein